MPRPPSRPTRRIDPRLADARPRRRVATAVAVLVLVALAGGAAGYAVRPVGGVEAALVTRGHTSAAVGNDRTDVLFAEMMAAHDQQVTTMAALAQTRGVSRAVKDLGFTREYAHQGEYDTVTDWLTADWPPSTATPARVPGQASAAEVRSLQDATGTAFDTAYVDLAIRSDQGALVMAREELAHGRSAEATGLAASLLVTQTADIDRLRGLRP